MKDILIYLVIQLSMIRYSNELDALVQCRKECNSLPEVDGPGERNGIVVILLVFVHPDLGCPTCVPGEHVAGAAREGVGMLLTEHVANSGARHDLQAASTLPHAETDLCNSNKRISLLFSATPPNVSLN